MPPSYRLSTAQSLGRKRNSERERKESERIGEGDDTRGGGVEVVRSF